MTIDKKSKSVNIKPKGKNPNWDKLVKDLLKHKIPFTLSLKVKSKWE